MITINKCEKMSKKNLGYSFKSAFRPKNILILLIGSLVIYFLIVLATQIQFFFILTFILYTSIIGVLLYLYIKWLSSQERPIKNRLFLGLLLFWFILFFSNYKFAFIHEMGHALVANFRGVPILDFVVNDGGSGTVSIPDSTSNLDKSMISIAGSLGLIFVNAIIIIVIYSKNNLPFEIFLSIFFISGQKILNQIDYWMSSIINNNYDAGVFLSANPSTNPNWLHFVFNLAYIYGLIILILLFLYKTIIKTVAFLGEQIPDINFAFLAN